MTGTAPSAELAGPAHPTILATEVFSAIQGEAALVGERQVFVRLTGCNIRCTYCDQPEALDRRPGPCRVEQSAGRRDWRTVESPLAVAELVDAAAVLWEQVPHHSISLTGGEPLLQAPKVHTLLHELAGRGWPVMLETNGMLVPVLRRVLPSLAYVSMDIKLGSVDGQGVRLDLQAAFLREALAAGAVTWAKVVLGPATDLDEFERALAMVADASRLAGIAGRGVEVFLQPLTPFGAATRAPTPEQVLELQGRALRIHPNVRVVPQTHKAIGQL